MKLSLPHPTYQEPHLTHPKYRPDIDGLRAIAVLAVVCFHAFPNMLRGGFVGVDIFFVISGFLISTIIFGSLERNTFSFMEFYARRIRRILPALLFVLLATFIFGWFALLPDEYQQLGKHMLAGTGFVSNIVLLQESGYFDNAAETKPLLHLWSLGIEEQFYIVWPLLLWAAWKKNIKLLSVSLLVAVISFSLNVKGIQKDAVRTFFSPQTRFWELLVGSLLAWWTLHGQGGFAKFTHKLDRGLGKAIFALPPEPNGTTLRDVSAALGGLLIATAFFVVNKEKLFPGWWALLPTLGTVLIVSAGPQAWLNRTLLSNRVVVWFGLISFPLYLWHWPLLTFARIIEGGMPARSIRIAIVVISIAFAWLTYKLIEKPIRSGRHNNAKTGFLVLLLIVVGCAGFGIYSRDGLVFRNEAIEKNNLQIEFGKKFYSNDYCKQAYPNFGGYYCIKTKPSAPTVQVLGDSHGNRLIMGLDASSNENILQLSHHACPNLSGIAVNAKPGVTEVCAEASKQALQVAENTESIKTVIINFRGGGFYIGKTREFDISLDGDYSGKSADDVLQAAMRETFDRLLAKKKRIIFVLDNPQISFNAQSCAYRRPFTNRPLRELCAVPRAEFDQRQVEYEPLMKSILKDYPSIDVLNSAEIFCDKDFCYAGKNSAIFYSDDNHLSLAGSLLVGRELSKLMRQQSGS